MAGAMPVTCPCTTIMHVFHDEPVTAISGITVVTPGTQVEVSAEAMTALWTMPIGYAISFVSPGPELNALVAPVLTCRSGGELPGTVGAPMAMDSDSVLDGEAT